MRPYVARPVAVVVAAPDARVDGLVWGVGEDLVGAAGRHGGRVRAGVVEALALAGRVEDAGAVQAGPAAAIYGQAVDALVNAVGRGIGVSEVRGDEAREQRAEGCQRQREARNRRIGDHFEDF